MDSDILEGIYRLKDTKGPKMQNYFSIPGKLK